MPSLLLHTAKVRMLELCDLLIIERDRSTPVPLFTHEVEPRRWLMTTETWGPKRKLTTLSPRSLIVVPASETSKAKNSQPFVLGNFSCGCFTMASNGTSWRIVPTGYSLSDTIYSSLQPATVSWSAADLEAITAIRSFQDLTNDFAPSS